VIEHMLKRHYLMATAGRRRGWRRPAEELDGEVLEFRVGQEKVRARVARVHNSEPNGRMDRTATCSVSVQAPTCELGIGLVWWSGCTKVRP
jgi:phage terminase large subunit-like protein